MTTRWIGAIILVIIGVILLLSNYSLLPENFDILRLWPILLIIWGAWIIITLTGKKKEK